MALYYKLTADNREARPRSKRLRELGVTKSAKGSSIITVNTAGNSGNVLTHTHANKTALDQISTDNDGYAWLTRTVEVKNPDTGEIDVQVVTEKVKAGYADLAFDLTKDSPVAKRFLSRIADDIAEGRITFQQGLIAANLAIFQNGAQFGSGFAEGLTGFGGMIDAQGNAQMQSLVLRQFLEVPEIRFNRTQVLLGNQWSAPGLGIVEWVVPDVDANGNTLPTGTMKLHLEDGEIGAVAEDDLCMGIFHDGVDLATNAATDSDDGLGNFTFAGFRSVYFRITQIKDPGMNSELRYALRPVSERFKTQWHPSEAMHFVCYGNPTDTSRQKSKYATRTYERYLTGVNTWEFTEANIAAQFGDLSNLSIFGLDMTGYSIYLNNIYMTGIINQIRAYPLRMEIDVRGPSPMAWGEELPVVCSVYRGWEEVTDRVTRWSVARDSGVPQDDALWALKPKVKGFAGSLRICLTAAENDLGNPPDGVTTLFTFRAEIDGEAEPVEQGLIMG